MPELPEVETVVRSLAPRLRNRLIRHVDILHRPSVAGSPRPVPQAAGKRILSVRRQAKFIRIDLDHDWGLTVHLRMTGWLGVMPPEHACALGPHVRSRLALDDGAESLIFSDIRTFGRIWCGTAQELNNHPALAKLGPDALEISVGDFVARLKTRKGRLKSVLLDQTFVAGLGNIYADEVLFSSGLHPLAVAGRVREEKMHALHASIRNILARAIKAGGTSISDFLNPDREPGFFTMQLKAYGREGERCVRCGGSIRRIVLGQRGTWFCPECQTKR